MPMYPYRVEDPARSHLPAEVIETLENWVNHGDGENAEYDLSEFWYRLLCGQTFRAARLGSKTNLAAMGWIMAELAENAPGTCFGSPENVGSWRGLVEEDTTLLTDQ